MVLPLKENESWKYLFFKKQKRPPSADLADVPAGLPTGLAPEGVEVMGLPGHPDRGELRVLGGWRVDPALLRADRLGDDDRFNLPPVLPGQRAPVMEIAGAREFPIRVPEAELDRDVREGRGPDPERAPGSQRLLLGT